MDRYKWNTVYWRAGCWVVFSGVSYLYLPIGVMVTFTVFQVLFVELHQLTLELYTISELDTFAEVQGAIKMRLR